MTDSGNWELAQEWPRRVKLTRGAVVTVLMAAMATGSVSLAQIALSPDCDCSSGWFKGVLLALAALLMALPSYFVVAVLHRKITTGRFLLTRAESAAKRKEHFAKMGAGKPFWPQAWLWSFAFGLAAFFLALGVLAIAVAVHSGHSSAKAMSLLLVLAAVCLSLPGWMLFKAIQRKVKTGSYLPSQDELAVARAKCGKLQPLWQRITFSAIYILLAILWTGKTLRRYPHDLHQWLFTAFWWLIAAIWTWQIFWRRTPACALPEPPNPLRVTPADEPAKPPRAS